jgi:hypothetical protein
MVATPYAIQDHLEPDGSLLVRVHLENGELAEIRFSREDAVYFVRIVQEAMLERATTALENTQIATLALQDSGTGTGPLGPSVRVTIDRVGMFALGASDAALRKLASDIEHVLDL